MSVILRSCSNWSDFRTALENLPPKEKGDAFEVLTQLYLRIEPKYATKLSDVWRLSDVPSAVRKHLRLPLLDEGIDLVAKTRDGAFWAIQCKYRSDETKSLTRRDLSTFTDLAFGVCRNFDHALVCTTADRFSRKLKLHEGRLSYCAGDVWRGLDAAFFNQTSVLELN